MPHAAAQAKEELPVLQSLETVTDLDGEHKGELRRTKAALDKAEKVRILIAQLGPNEKKLPDVTVTINDYTYQIQRGKGVDVPRPVYEILVQSGIIAPLFEKDEPMSPTLDPQVQRAQRYAVA